MHFVHPPFFSYLPRTSCPFCRLQLLWGIREVFDCTSRKDCCSWWLFQLPCSQTLISLMSPPRIYRPHSRKKPARDACNQRDLLWSVTSSASVMVMVYSCVYFYSDMELMGSGWVSCAAAVQEQMHYHVFHQRASAAALHLHAAFSVQLHPRLCHQFRGSSNHLPVLTVILFGLLILCPFFLVGQLMDSFSWN